MSTHKFYDTSDPNGFPIELDKFLKFIQEAYSESISALIAAFGNNVIVNGCVETGTGSINVSNGFIICNNQLVQFIGGVKSPTFYLTTTDENLIFQGGVSKPVLHNVTGQFGSSSSLQFNWSDLRRINKLVDTWVDGDVKMVNCDNAYIAANFDASGLALANSVRAGWAICNGENGTVDMRGRFAIAYDDRSVDPANSIWDAVYNNMGAIDGDKEVTLTASEIPSLNVTIPRAGYAGIGGSGNLFVGTANSPSAGTQNVAVAGTGGLAHNNIPPFRVTLFIEKL